MRNRATRASQHADVLLSSRNDSRRWFCIVDVILGPGLPLGNPTRETSPLVNAPALAPSLALVLVWLLGRRRPGILVFENRLSRWARQR